MFSEFDILEKEMANDDYKFSCIIECACMEAEVIDMDDSAVVTEAEGDDVASKIKEKFAATSRCMPFDQTPIGETCVCCGKPAKKLIYFAKAY